MHVLGLPPAFVLSQDQTLKLKPPKGFLTSNLAHLSSPPGSGDTSVHRSHSREPTNSEADTLIIACARGPICKLLNRTNDQTAHISLQISINVKKQRKQNRGSSANLSTPSPVIHSQNFRQSRASQRRSPAPTAFPPSVKRCLRPRHGLRKRKNHALAQKSAKR